jgi:hypothetical protein
VLVCVHSIFGISPHWIIEYGDCADWTRFHFDANEVTITQTRNLSLSSGHTLLWALRDGVMGKPGTNGDIQCIHHINFGL